MFSNKTAYKGTGRGIKFPLLLVNEGENILNKVLDFLMKIVFLVCACISIAAVITICVFMFANGVPAIKEIGITKFPFWNTVACVTEPFLVYGQ